MAKSALNQYILPTYMFKIRSWRYGTVIEVNEYTLRNIRLQVALKKIKPFWLLNTEGKWEECRIDGCFRGYPHSDQFTPTRFQDCALSVSDDLARVLFRTFINKKKD